MSNQSDYMKNRLQEYHQKQISNATRALYILIGYTVLSGALLLTVDPDVRGLFNLVLAMLYFAILNDKKIDQKTQLQRAFWLTVFLAVLSLLTLRVVALIILAIVAYFVHVGIDSAKYLADKTSSGDDDNVLDANFWNKDEK